MNLYELAYACRLYREVAQFDPAYADLCKALGPSPDLVSQMQQDALLRFLNAWLCRIPEKNFPALRQRLAQWAAIWVLQLPKPGADIRSLQDTERAQIGKAYEQLLCLGAGMKFQDTAAGKTLHALRPGVLPMWDSEIRDWFSASGPPKRTSGQIYSDFLRHVANQISELEMDVTRLTHSVADVPRLVQRSGATLVKLVDEYYWITITKGHVIPTRNDLEQWLRWIE
jgi:hypothetical protein